MADIPHAQLCQITSSKLAVDRQVEQSELPTPVRNLRAHTDRPNLLELKWRFLANELSLVSRLSRAMRIDSTVSMTDSFCCKENQSAPALNGP